MKQKRTLCKECGEGEWGDEIARIVYYPGREGFKTLTVEVKDDLRLCAQCYQDEKMAAILIAKSFEKALPKRFLWIAARVYYKGGRKVEVQRGIVGEK